MIQDKTIVTLECERETLKGKWIYTALFVVPLALQVLRHGSHSITCKLGIWTFHSREQKVQRWNFHSRGTFAPWNIHCWGAKSL